MTYKDHVSRQLEPEEPEEPEDQNKASRKRVQQQERMAIGRVPKNTRLETLLNYKVRVTTSKNSTFMGTLLSYDKFMNLVLVECEEFRLLQKTKKYLDQVKNGDVDQSKVKEQKRLLGLVILRGENVVSVVAEAAPNANTLKPQLRLKKGKTSVKPLMKKMTSDKSSFRSDSGVQKPNHNTRR